MLSGGPISGAPISATPVNTVAASTLLLRLLEEGLFVHAMVLALLVWGGA